MLLQLQRQSWRHTIRDPTTAKYVRQNPTTQQKRKWSSDEGGSSSSSSDKRSNFGGHGGGPSDDGGGGQEDDAFEGLRAHKRRTNDDDGGWKFDGCLLKPPKAYDGTDLAYFQPWLEMLKSEMMSEWEPCGAVLKVLEEAGERRSDPIQPELQPY